MNQKQIDLIFNRMLSNGKAIIITDGKGKEITGKEIPTYIDKRKVDIVRTYKDTLMIYIEK
ncbi:hypothetical protein [Clostridium sp.]|uniref:hypothetical protein n=1 Tax=Clostridium sp. TaxID=1506 RepID=UPI001A53BE69|nr:hypothetical protein [Clostridium sp.]MBK5234076.1 hypothetical protein [Clostridium sp.]